jgi:YbbR domain-containing protein
VTDQLGKWGLRLLAFVVAVVVWWIASVEKRERSSEKVIDASVSYNAPAGMILLDPRQNVRVRLRGPERQIRALTPFAVDVVVDIATDSPGTHAIQLTAENVIVPQEIEVVLIEPNVLELRLDREATALVPVIVPLVGEPAGGAVPDDPRITPNRVRVRGPESLISGLTSISTSPISLDGHALDFSQSVSVVSSDPLVRVVEPMFVKVQIPMHSPDLTLESDEKERAAPADGRRR